MAQYCPPYPHIHRDQSNLQYRGELLDDYVYNVDRELINPNLLRPGSRYRFLRLHCYRVPIPTIRRRTTSLYRQRRRDRRWVWDGRGGAAGSARYGIVRKSVKALSLVRRRTAARCGTVWQETDILAYAYARNIYFSSGFILRERSHVSAASRRFVVRQRTNFTRQD